MAMIAIAYGPVTPQFLHQFDDPPTQCVRIPYLLELSLTNAVRCRDPIGAPWYQPSPARERPGNASPLTSCPTHARTPGRNDDTADRRQRP